MAESPFNTVEASLPLNPPTFPVPLQLTRCNEQQQKVNQGHDSLISIRALVFFIMLKR